jgi:hypothetical protein
MSFSKTLTSAVAAVTVAGAVGLAYAQSTPDTTTPAAPASADTSQPASNTAPPSTMGTQPSGTATPSDNTSSGMSTDLEPKADRN